MGMRTNQVDRDVYKFGDSETKTAQYSAKDLKDKMSEKLKYILSDKDTYDPFENKKKLKMSKQIIIPQKFLHYDKI